MTKFLSVLWSSTQTKSYSQDPCINSGTCIQQSTKHFDWRNSQIERKLQYEDRLPVFRGSQGYDQVLYDGLIKKMNQPDYLVKINILK